METNKILSANILDILFEGKNKDYGAYDLRKTYNKRIGTALCITAIIIAIFTLAFTGSKVNHIAINKRIDIDVSLSKKEKEKILPHAAIIPKAKTIKTVPYAPPIIVKDKMVTEPPVEIEKLIEAAIDTKKTEGENDNGINLPDDIKGSKVLEAPLKNYTEDDNKFIPVEIEATFKGDWNAYIKKEIEKNIEELTEAGESGTCIVKFIVSKDGAVSDVEAITMKGSKLAEVAVNAIRKGPKWIPARQNGREVNAYRQQPITFKINE